jgi:hypothetical protein
MERLMNMQKEKPELENQVHFALLEVLFIASKNNK